MIVDAATIFEALTRARVAFAEPAGPHDGVIVHVDVSVRRRCPKCGVVVACFVSSKPLERCIDCENDWNRKQEAKMMKRRAVAELQVEH